MYEYEVEITLEDNGKAQHKIKRYYVCQFMGKDDLKKHIESMLEKDKEISQYKAIGYTVLNYEE